MSNLKQGIDLLKWNDRISRFKEEEDNRNGLIAIAFLLGILFGMFIVEILIPGLLELTLV